MFKTFADFSFRIFKYVFKNKFEAYIFDHSLKNAQTQLEQKHKNYLRMLASDPTFEEIINIHIASIVQAGFAVKGREGLLERKNWVDALNYMKGLTRGSLGTPDPKYNPLTGENFKDIANKKEET